MGTLLQVFSHAEKAWQIFENEKPEFFGSKRMDYLLWREKKKVWEAKNVKM